MSKDHKSSGFSYYLKLFLAEIPSGKPAKKDTAITGSHSDQTKPESAAARELTARALEIYLGRKPSPEALSSLARTPQGKPYFPDYPDFQYNVSYSGRYVVCGMICGGGDPQPVGIDIQEIPSNPERAMKIADHFFSEPEKESLRALLRKGDSSSALLLFCRCWTARESYMKLTGRGLAEPFGNYRPDLEHKRIILANSAREVYLTECEAPAGYCLTACSYVPLETGCILWDRVSG